MIGSHEGVAESRHRRRAHRTATSLARRRIIPPQRHATHGFPSDVRHRLPGRGIRRGTFPNAKTPGLMEPRRLQDAALQQLTRAGDGVRTRDIQLGKHGRRSGPISICAHFKRLATRLRASALTNERRIARKCAPTCPRRSLYIGVHDSYSLFERKVTNPRPQRKAPIIVTRHPPAPRGPNSRGGTNVRRRDRTPECRQDASKGGAQMADAAIINHKPALNATQQGATERLRCGDPSNGRTPPHFLSDGRGRALPRPLPERVRAAPPHDRHDWSGRGEHRGRHEHQRRAE